MTDGETERKDPSFGDLPPNHAFPPLTALRAFDAVARLGGVRRAAEVLGMDHSAISRHLQSVERTTGVALFVRSGRGLALTEEGLRYHAKVAAAMDALAEATLGLLEHSDDARLVVWCMPGLAVEWLLPRLYRFQDENPGLTLDLRPTDRMPDFSRHEAATAIRYFSDYDLPERVPPEARVLELFRSDLIPVASPAYLARSAKIRRPEDLLGHPLIEDEVASAWRAWLERQGLQDQRDVTGPKFWHGHMALDAARRGHGVLLATRFISDQDLASGRLVEVTGENGTFPTSLRGGYAILSREDAWDAKPVRRFRDWMTSMLEGPTAA